MHARQIVLVCVCVFVYVCVRCVSGVCVCVSGEIVRVCVLGVSWACAVTFVWCVGLFACVYVCRVFV